MPIWYRIKQLKCQTCEDPVEEHRSKLVCNGRRRILVSQQQRVKRFWHQVESEASELPYKFPKKQTQLTNVPHSPTI